MNEPKSGLGAIILPRTYNVEFNLYEALKGVPSVSELSKKFGDSGDILKYRRRQLIAAALDAIFYSKFFYPMNMKRRNLPIHSRFCCLN
jgi:hypothetical protein